jgi:hypothetical protein
VLRPAETRIQITEKVLGRLDFGRKKFIWRDKINLAAGASRLTQSPAACRLSYDWVAKRGQRRPRSALCLFFGLPTAKCNQREITIDYGLRAVKCLRRRWRCRFLCVRRRTSFSGSRCFVVRASIPACK